MICRRAEYTPACITTDKTGEGMSKSTPCSARILLASQNKAFQNPSKWAKSNSSFSLDSFQNFTHPCSRLAPITSGREHTAITFQALFTRGVQVMHAQVFI